MLSGYMTGPGVCGYVHRRQVNTRKHKTELAYIGRAPFKRRPHSPVSSLVDFFRRPQQPRAAAKFLGLVGSVFVRHSDWSTGSAAIFPQYAIQHAICADRYLGTSTPMSTPSGRRVDKRQTRLIAAKIGQSNEAALSDDYSKGFR
jgi:hypothetical protein